MTEPSCLRISPLHWLLETPWPHPDATLAKRFLTLTQTEARDGNPAS